jgi:hypothetical protein
MADIFSRILGAAANRIEARQKQKKTEGGQRLARYDAKTQSYVYLDGSPVTVAQVLTNGAIADGQVVSATKGFIDAPVTAIEKRTERKRRRAKTGEGIAYIYTKTVQVDRPGTVFHGRDYTGIFFVDREGNTQQLDGEITVLYRLEGEREAWRGPPTVTADVIELKVERQCPFFSLSVSWYPIADKYARQSTHVLESTIDTSFQYFYGYKGVAQETAHPDTITEISYTSRDELEQLWSSGFTISPHVVEVQEDIQPGTYVCATADLDFFFFRVEVGYAFVESGVVSQRGGSFKPNIHTVVSWNGKTGAFFFRPRSKDIEIEGLFFYPELGDANTEKYPGLRNVATTGNPIGWGFKVDNDPLWDGVWVMAWVRKPDVYAFFSSHGVHDWQYFFARNGSITNLSLNQDDPSEESSEDWRFPSQVYEDDPDWDDPCFEQFSDNNLANLVGDTVFSVTTPLSSITDLEAPVSVQVRPVTRNGNSCSLGAPSTAQIKLKVLLPPDSTVIAAAVIL